MEKLSDINKNRRIKNMVIIVLGCAILIFLGVVLFFNKSKESAVILEDFNVGDRGSKEASTNPISDSPDSFLDKNQNLEADQARIEDENNQLEDNSNSNSKGLPAETVSGKKLIPNTLSAE